VKFLKFAELGNCQIPMNVLALTEKPPLLKANQQKDKNQ